MTNVNDLPQLLFERVPGLKSALADDFKIWAAAAAGVPPNADYVFSSMLAPFVARLLQKEDSESHLLNTRIFQFLEELMHDDNPAVRDTVEVSFCEQLASDPAARRRASKYMGKELRQSIESSSA